MFQDRIYNTKTFAFYLEGEKEIPVLREKHITHNTSNLENKRVHK